MEKANIVRVEDEIQFAFENFNGFTKNEQKNLIEIVTKKFKVDEMQFPVREPVFYGIAEYALPAEHYPLRSLITHLLDHDSFACHLKQNINEPKIKVLQDFLVLMQLYGDHDIKWQRHMAALDTSLATTIINMYLTSIKKEIDNRYCADYRILGFTKTVLELYKISGIKLGDLVLTIKSKPKLLEHVCGAAPEAEKYVNMI